MNNRVYLSEVGRDEVLSLAKPNLPHYFLPERRLGDGTALPGASVIGDSSLLRIEPEAWSSYPEIGRNPIDTGNESIGFSFAHRLAVAEVEGRTVITPGNPGVSPNESAASRELRRALWHAGDFRVGAALQWQSIDEAATRHGIELGDDLHLGGASLGAYVVSGLVGSAPKGVQISRIDLRETPHLSPDVSLAEFVKSYFTYAGEHQQEYEEQNPEWAQKNETKKDIAMFVARALGYRATGIWGYGLAIHQNAKRQAFETDIVAAQGKLIDPEAPINIINGDSSKISPTKDNDELAERLEDAGYKNVKRLVVKGGTHANGESVPQIANIHSHLRAV